MHCELCDKWMDPSNYKRHQLAHNNERPYVCDVAECNKAFTQLVGLQRHKRSVHERVRAYKCDQCDYSCAQKGDLRQHQLAVHEQQKPHACQHCTYKCVRLSLLRQHCKSMHKGHPLHALVKR